MKNVISGISSSVADYESRCLCKRDLKSRFSKKGSCDLIQFSGKENGKRYMKKYKVYTAFLFMGHAFWKESIEDRVKLLESNVLNCCL